MKKLLVWLVLLSGAASATWWNYPPARELAAPYLPAWINQLAPVETAKAPEPKRKGPPPAPVTAATVTLADMPILISAPGTVETKASIAVKPRVDGQAGLSALELANQVVASLREHQWVPEREELAGPHRLPAPTGWLFTPAQGQREAA